MKWACGGTDNTVLHTADEVADFMLPTNSRGRAGIILCPTHLRDPKETLQQQRVWVSEVPAIHRTVSESSHLAEHFGERAEHYLENKDRERTADDHVRSIHKMLQNNATEINAR